MTREEIEKAIKNGENVWYPKNRTIKQIDLKNTHPIFNGYQIDIMIEDENGWHTEFYGISDLYKTKAEAEHYLHHANVTRTETLPFLTWEEFKKEHYFGFNSIYNEWIDVYVTNGLDNKMIITIENATKEEFINNYDLTEENFYRVYDECVRLFKGDE